MKPWLKTAKVQKGNNDFCVGVNRVRDYRFILNLSYPGRMASVKQQIVDMTLNGSGVRDIARVLHVSTRTVIAELKKSRYVERRQSRRVRATRPATS